MTVFKKSNGRWCVQVYDRGTGRMRQVGTYATKRDAKSAEATSLAAASPNGRETVAQFAARWLTVFPRRRQSTNVHNGAHQGVHRHQRRRRMDSITVAEARVWALQRPSDLAALRAMFNDARRLELVTTNPFSALGIERGRGRRDLPSEWLTVTDVTHLEETARAIHREYGDTMAAIVRFAVETGIRPGELFVLQRGDLLDDTLVIRRAADSKTRTITPPKNGRARTVVLTAAARAAAMQAVTFHGSDLVFSSPQGRQFWQLSFAYSWNPVRKAAGRSTMAFYELRHYCATRLLELGLSPADVAVQLGHTDGGALVMSTYGHPSENAARARILAATEAAENGSLTTLRGAEGAGCVSVPQPLHSRSACLPRETRRLRAV